MRERQKRKAASCSHLAPSRSAFEGLLAAAGWPGQPGDAHLVCLGCGTRSATLEQHSQRHAAPGKPGHEVVLDRRTQELYCTRCSDFVYNPEFDALKLAIRGTSCPALSADSALPSDAAGASVTQPGHFGAAPAAEAIPAQPAGGVSAAAAQAMQPAGPAAAPAGAAHAAAAAGPAGGFQPVADDGFPAGLRGLNNMGNTCFMNSILQGLLHAPLLRNYYLLGHHTKQECPITGEGGFCVSCELDEVFNEAYSGVRTAYSPAQFLYTWWMLAGSHLGSYQQHDAHEFLLFVLEMLSSTPGAGNISSKVFGGTLRSDVICSSCGYASTTQDPFTHLSLDIPPREQLIPLPILPRPGGGGGGAGASAAAAGGSKAQAPITKGGIKLYGAAAASAAAAAARNSAARRAAAEVAAGAAPSSSTDHLGGSSSDADACEDEAAGSTFVGGGNDKGRGAGGGGPHGDSACSPPLGHSRHGAHAAAHQDVVSTSQLEAASAVGGLGAALADDDSEDAAQDTLSSPRTLQGGGKAFLASATAAHAQAAGHHGRGRPPIPRGKAGGGKRGSGSGRAAQTGRQQSTGGEAEPGPGTLMLSGMHLAEPSDAAMATEDALAAASNLPGSQSTAAVGLDAAHAAATAAAPGHAGPGGALPPQLAGYQRWPAASLLGCLHRFTRQEELGAREGVECARCRSRRAYKQLSLRALPPVLVLHTKRFEHPGGARAAARKLETDLSFPLTGLDMRPFLSSSVLRARHGLRSGASAELHQAMQAQASSPPALHRTPSTRSTRSTPGSSGGGARGGGKRAAAASSPASPTAAAGAASPTSAAQHSGASASAGGAAAATEDFLYDLYAVVCHRGNFQGGHYVAYVRGGDGRWYLCDDAWVVGVDEAVVRQVQAYMLFYARKGLLS